jgi:proteasome lid subunit RPN8/RPN11
MNLRGAVLVSLLTVVTLVAAEIAVIAHLATPTPRYQAKDNLHPKGVPQPAESADDAARQVFEYIYARSHAYEYGGVILKYEGGVYMASDPDTQLRGDEVKYEASPLAFPTGKIVASYHTHPCTRQTFGAYFSDDDLREIVQDQRPAYMADLCTGDIHYWAPGDALSLPIFHMDAQLANGRIVGHIKVDGIVLQ